MKGNVQPTMINATQCGLVVRKLSLQRYLSCLARLLHYIVKVWYAPYVKVSSVCILYSLTDLPAIRFRPHYHYHNIF